MKLVNLTLPEWTWLSGGEHEPKGDSLEGRSLVYHTKSASVIEFFEEADFLPSSENLHTLSFKYTNFTGYSENHIAVLHYSATVDDDDEKVIEEILRGAAQWYTKYLKWEDKNILDEGRAYQN